MTDRSPVLMPKDLVPPFLIASWKHKLTKETKDSPRHLGLTLSICIASGLGRKWTILTVLPSGTPTQNAFPKHFPSDDLLCAPVGFIRPGRRLVLSLLVENIIICKFGVFFWIREWTSTSCVIGNLPPCQTELNSSCRHAPLYYLL